MGAVWRARGPQGEPVAVKLLLAGEQATPLQQRRFEDEARALLRLRHPALVRALDGGVTAGVPYLVLEWVEGESLQARLDRQGPLHPADAVELVRRLALALEHCHRHGLLHRDLKPGNVLLRASDGAPLLVDFGLARALDPQEGRSLHTRTGQGVGTPGWWPPEQVHGRRHELGTWSDVYGLGGLLYAALCGRRPQAGETLLEVLAALERPPAPPSQHRPGVPPELDALTLLCLDPDPARRPQRAADVALALERWQRRSRRRGASRTLLAGLVLLLAAVGVAAAWPGREGPAGAAPIAGASIVSSAASRAPDARGLALRALERVRAGDAAGGLVLAEEALRLDRDEPAAWRARGHARRALGEFQAAQDDLLRVLMLETGPALPLARQAQAREREGDPSGALALWARALELAPRSAWLHILRGASRAQLGDRAGALADCDRAVALDPDSVLCRQRRALAREEAGDLTGALEDANRCLALEEEDPGLWALRGRLRAGETRDLAGARADLDRAVELAPRDPEIRVQRAMLRRSQGELEGALEDLDRAIVEGSRLAAAWRDRGRLRHQLGRDRRGAREDLTRAIELAPQDPVLHALLGEVCAALGDGPAAVAALDRAIELAPERANLWRDRALVRLARRQPAEAGLDLARAVALDPQDLQAWVGLASAREQTGDAAGARQALERARAVAGPGRQAELEELRRRLQRMSGQPR